MYQHTIKTDSRVMDYRAIIIKATPNPTRFDRFRAWIFEKVTQLRVDNLFMVGLLFIGMLIQREIDTPVVIWIHAQSHMSAHTWGAFMVGAAGLAWALRQWYWMATLVSFAPLMALVVFHIQYILTTDAPDYVVVLYLSLLLAYITIAICGPYIKHFINMIAAYDQRVRELEDKVRMLKPGETNATTDANTAGI